VSDKNPHATSAPQKRILKASAKLLEEVMRDHTSEKREVPSYDSETGVPLYHGSKV